MSVTFSRRARPVALVALVAGLVHARALAAAWTGLDDVVLIVDRRAWLARLGSVWQAFARGYFGPRDAYYRPVVTVSFVLDAQTGASPFGYHVTNLLLHVLASSLVYWLLRRLRFCEWWSALGAICFATHPALVESVAWVPGRNDSLLAVGALGAWLALERARQDGGPWPKLLHGLAFAGALFTKETAIVLPSIYLGWLLIVDRRATRARWLWMIWIAALGLYFAARTLAIGLFPAGHAPAPLAQLPGLLFGVGKLVVPAHLAPIAIARDTPVWPGVVAIVVLVWLARAVPAARRSMLALGAAMMIVPLLPGLLTSGQLMLENRLYLSGVGLAIYLAELGRAVADRRARAGAVVLVVVFAIMTTRYEAAFADPGTFTAAAVAASPHSSLAHLQRGIWLQRSQGDVAAAADEYRAAIACDTTEPMVHNNLGVVLMNERHLEEAEGELRLEVSMHPENAVAHFNLGLVLRDRGQLPGAARAWEETLRLDPDHIDAMGELMVQAQRAGDRTLAQHYLDELTRHGAKLLSPGP